MINKIVVPRILQPRTLNVRVPNSLMLCDKIYKEEPKKLLFAVAGGSVPPPGGNGPENISPFNNKFTKEFIKKIKEMTKDMNNLTRKGFDIIKNHNHIKK